MNTFKFKIRKSFTNLPSVHVMLMQIKATVHVFWIIHD